MNQLEQLMQALQQQRAQQQAQMIQSEAAMAPMEQKWINANTRSFRGLIPGLIETAVDSHRRKKLEPEYTGALQQALSSAAGYDDLNSQLAAIQAQMAEEEARAYSKEKFDYEAKAKADQDIRVNQAKPVTPTILERNLAAAGIDPRSPEGRNLIEQNLTKGQTAYNITIPTGYRPVDPANPAAGFAVIPGSPQEMEAQAAEEAKQAGVEGRAYSASGVLSAIDRALENVGPTTAGWGSLAANIPATKAKTLQGDLSTVQANLAFDRLQKMRDESKTGGALGQVSNIELDLLKNTWASVQQAQSPEELKKRLMLVRQHYQNFTDAISGKMPAGYDASGNPVSGGVDLDQMAREAIAAGADPVAVRRRIEELRGKR